MMYLGIGRRKARRLALFSVFLILACLFFIIYGRSAFRMKRKLPEALPYTVETVKVFPFSDAGSLKEWEEKVFKGRVVYNIEKGEALSYVKAKSQASASALYYKLKIDAKNKQPVVSWKWRVEKFPQKKFPENLDTQTEDDFSARVYVIFPAMFFTNSKVLEYIWAEKLPVGTTGTSPYSPNIKLIVLRSGPSKEWVTEKRDIVADYMKLFGRLPEFDIGAVAFMTNAEHTGTSADAMYDDIELGYKKEESTPKGGRP